jgi:two-component system alkaline phosphatase synthesis response regulator PhoP
MFAKFLRLPWNDDAERDATPAPASRYDVLVVDDDVHLRELLRQALEHGGYRVHVGENGAEAVRLAHENPPDLIIIDGNMPVMDGLEAVRKLKANRGLAAIPVIMLTMRSHQVDMITGYRFGVQAYLTKPIALEQLLVTVRKLLAGK